MNAIRSEKFQALKEAFARGASIRDAMREVGCAMNTAARYKRMFQAETVPVSMVDQPLSDIAGLCRYMPQPDRVKIWEAAEGPVPEGKRVGWLCKVPYCDNPEHMALADNGNFHKRSYKEIRGRVWELQEGEYFDLPDEPNDAASILKFRTALSVKAPHLLFRSLPSGGVRIIRYGDFYQPKTEFYEAFPVLNVRQPAPCFQLRSGAFYLGLMMCLEAELVFVRPQKCAVKSCVHPTLHGAGDYCYQHNHFFDYNVSMTDSTLDRSSLFKPWLGIHSHAYELAAEFLTGTASLEKSLRFTLAAPAHRSPVYDERHKNAGNILLPIVQASPNMRRMGHGKGHGSSKTTTGRARAIARQGPGGRHNAKEKRWTRETIESLEQQADEILGLNSPEVLQKAEEMQVVQSEELLGSYWHKKRGLTATQDEREWRERLWEDYDGDLARIAVAAGDRDWRKRELFDQEESL